MKTHVIKACIEQNIPVLLRGETGTGKTTTIREIAEQEGKKLTRINLTGQTTREDLVGKYILRDSNLAWQNGPLVTALRAGHWILLDEINAALPEVLFLLQSLLEAKNQLGTLLLVEKDGEELIPHEDCRIFATCNPSDYEGMKDMNPATLSRFVVIDVQPLDVAEEEKLLIDRYGVDIARSLVESANQARQKKKDGETTVFVSTRDLELACRLYQKGVKADLAVETAIITKCQNEADRMVIQKCFNVKTSSSKKSFIDELEELKTENANLKKEAKSATELLETIKAMQKSEGPAKKTLEIGGGKIEIEQKGKFRKAGFKIGDLVKSQNDPNIEGYVAKVKAGGYPTILELTKKSSEKIIAWSRNHEISSSYLAQATEKFRHVDGAFALIEPPLPF